MTTTCSEPATVAAQTLGYAFDPIPAAVKLDRLLGWITDFDLVVISEMIAIGAWRGRRDSCWTTKAVLADRLGVTTRTIQASWGRLKRRGWLFEELVGSNDPDDPRNHTGRRYFFGWMGDRRDPARFDAAPKPGGRRPRPIEPPSGERSASPPAEKILSPNLRENLSPEKTTDESVIMAPPGTQEHVADQTTRPSTPPWGSPTPTPSDLPPPLAEALGEPNIGPALRRRLTAAIPKWMGDGHPPYRVAAAIRAMLGTARRGPVRTPIGYVEGTLKNMLAEGDDPVALAPPPPPSRVPTADQTARYVEEIRRGEEVAAARHRRWEGLPEAERDRIAALDASENPRPPGAHARLWALARHAACLELMDSLRSPE
jgi:hypothetical protein